MRKNTDKIRREIYSDVMTRVSRELRPVLESGLGDNEFVRKHNQVRNNVGYDILKSDYRIVPILTPTKAKVQGKLLLFPTSKDGFNDKLPFVTFYACVRDDFYEVDPNDEDFNITKFFIVIKNYDGSVNIIRDRRGNIVSKDDFERITCTSLKKDFKPNDNDRLHEVGLKTFDDVERMLDDGKDPKRIFDTMKPFGKRRDAFFVSLGNAYNILVDDELLFDKWLEYKIEDLKKDGVDIKNLYDEEKAFNEWKPEDQEYHYKVRLDGYHGVNYMNDDFEFLFEKDDIYDCDCTPVSGYYAMQYEARQTENDRIIIVDSDERPLSNEKFYHIRYESQMKRWGCFEVERVDEKDYNIYNVMDADGNLLSDEWCSELGVYGGQLLYMVNRQNDGILLYDLRFKRKVSDHKVWIMGYRYRINENALFYAFEDIERQGRRFNIWSTETGRMISNTYYDNAEIIEINDGHINLIKVELNKKINFFDPHKGEFMLKGQWIDRIDQRDNRGRRRVFIGDTYNYLDSNYRLVGEWQMADGYETAGSKQYSLDDFDDAVRVFSHYNNFFIVQKNDRYYIFDWKNSELVNKTAFDECKVIPSGFFREYDLYFMVKVGGEYNVYVVREGREPKMMFDKGFDMICAYQPDRMFEIMDGSGDMEKLCRMWQREDERIRFNRPDLSDRFAGFGDYYGSGCCPMRRFGGNKRKGRIWTSREHGFIAIAERNGEYYIICRYDELWKIDMEKHDIELVRE